MKTKIFTLLLAVAASIGTMHAAIVNGTCGTNGDNLTWALNTKDSTLTISGSGTMANYSDEWGLDFIALPWDEYKAYIKVIIIEDGVTSIGNGAFHDLPNLTSATIGNSVATIGAKAFSQSDIYEDNREFQSRFTSVTMGNNVVSIGAMAFMKCERLTEITIPSSVTTIGRLAFYRWNRDLEIHINDLAAWCNVSLNDLCQYGALRLYLNNSEVKDLVIPEGVTSIKDWAFYHFSNLTSVSIPNSVTSIGANAFAGCSGLTHITMADNVTSIGNDAFSGCTGVTSLILSSSITSIGSNTFNGCSKLSTINIPNAVTSIGESAFRGCSNLTSISIPNKVTNIPNDVFNGCSKLASVNIGTGVSSIGNNAFCSCPITNLTVLGVTPPLGGLNSGFTPTSCNLYVRSSSLETYQNTIWWEDFASFNTVATVSFAVTFRDMDGTTLFVQYIEEGEAATPPADPTRTGYTFIGWDKDFSNITEDLVVTALYEINRYEVIFKDWDETILKTDSADYNTAATAPANPSHEGHEFIGWDKDFSHVSSDMIINARYAVNYYSVGFLNYDGTLLSEQSIAYNQAAMEPNVPTREGYTFIGWTADIKHITARTFAIALYEKDGINVTYISEEGDTIVSEKVDMHLPNAPIVSGKTFTGWLTESASNAEGIVFRATYTLDNPTTGEDVVVIPTSSTAGVSFPYITGAMTYMLVIRDLFGTVVCKIMFDADGHLLGIAFAPERNRTQKAQSEGFHFTVEGLTPGTTYEYEFVAYDEADQVIETLSGSFETTADETGVNNISSASAPQKVINDGHVLILRGDKTYTMQGQEVK